jgi:LysM repeat protein
MEPSTKDKNLLQLLQGERHRHRVALVTEEGDWNQHAPNTSTAKIFVGLFLAHLLAVVGFIVYDHFSQGNAASSQTSASIASAVKVPETKKDVVSVAAPVVETIAEPVKFYTVQAGDTVPQLVKKLGFTNEKEFWALNREEGKAVTINPGDQLKYFANVDIAVEDHAPLTQDMPEAPVQVASEVKSVVETAALPPVNVEDKVSEAVSEIVKDKSVKVNPIGQTEVQKDELVAVNQTKKTNVLVNTKTAPIKSSVAEETKKQKMVTANATVEKNEVIPVKKVKDTPPTQEKTKTVAVKEVKETAPEVTIPKAAAKTHVVKSGDTYYGIAKKYGISIAALEKANKGVKPTSLKVGAKIVIP